MRFQRQEKRPYQATHQKRTAILRRQRREVEIDFPLFAAEIVERQIPVDQELELLRRTHEHNERCTRSARAASWISARARLQSLEAAISRTILEYWNHRSRYPANPDGLHRLITRFERGQIKA